MSGKKDGSEPLPERSFAMRNGDVSNMQEQAGTGRTESEASVAEKSCWLEIFAVVMC